MSARRLTELALGEIKPNPANPKAHAGRLIAASIGRFGMVDPLVRDDRTGCLVSGHGRLEQLVALQAKGAPAPDGVTVAPGGEWRVQVLTGWESRNDAEASAYLLAANQATIEGGWNTEALDKMLLELSGSGSQLEQLLGTGFGKADVDAVLESLAPPTGDDEGAPLTATPAAPWVKEGTLYQLGAHRLFVGDSLLEANRRALIGDELVDLAISDPPYAIYGSSSGLGESIADDKMVLPFFEAYWRAMAMHLREFAHSYTFTDWRSWGSLALTLKRVPGLAMKNGLTWDKGGSGLGSNYAMTTEWVMFVHRLEPKKAMKSVNERTGMRLVHKPNIFRANRPTGEERQHNAAKPVSELREFLKASSDENDLVWDPFSGSGSTLIACERENRRCFTGEIDAVNAQITIERWQKATGKKAVEVKSKK